MQKARAGTVESQRRLRYEAIERIRRERTALAGNRVLAEARAVWSMSLGLQDEARRR